MDRGAWRAKVHRVTKSWMRLSDFHVLFFFFLPAAVSASALFPSMGYKHTTLKDLYTHSSLEAELSKAFSDSHGSSTSSPA